jgi:hypothetical protein
MSGIHALLLAGTYTYQFSVTIGDEPTVELVGYQHDNAIDPDEYGSIAPVDTFRGARICQIGSWAETDPSIAFRLMFVGSLPAGWFSKAVVEDGNGTLVTYLASDAVRVQTAGQTAWTWDNTFAHPWLDADISEVRTVRIIS